MRRKIYLGVQAGKSRVESVDGEFISSSRANASFGCDVGVVADFVGSSRVVDSKCFDKDLDVYLVQVLWDTEETSGKVLGGLDHAVLRFGAENRDSLLSGEVVQQFAVQLAVFNTEEEILAPAKGSQKLSTELVSPVGQESQFARNLETRSLGGICKLRGKCRWRSAAGRVSCTVAIQQMHLVDGASIRN